MDWRTKKILKREKKRRALKRTMEKFPSVIDSLLRATGIADALCAILVVSLNHRPGEKVKIDALLKEIAPCTQDVDRTFKLLLDYGVVKLGDTPDEVTVVISPSLSST